MQTLRKTIHLYRLYLILFLLDVHKNLPPLSVAFLEFVDCQRIQKLVGCTTIPGTMVSKLLTHQGK